MWNCSYKKHNLLSKPRVRKPMLIVASTALSALVLLSILPEGKTLKAQESISICDEMGSRAAMKEKVDLKRLKEYSKLKDFLDNSAATSIEIEISTNKKDIIGWALEINKVVEGMKPKIDVNVSNTGKKKTSGEGEELIVYGIKLSRQVETTKKETPAEVKASTETASAPTANFTIPEAKETERVEKAEKIAEPELPKQMRYRADFQGWFYQALDMTGSKGNYQASFDSYDVALNVLNMIRNELGGTVSKEPSYESKGMGIVFTVEKTPTGANLIFKAINK